MKGNGRKDSALSLSWAVGHGASHIMACYSGLLDFIYFFIYLFFIRHLPILLLKVAKKKKK